MTYMKVLRNSICLSCFLIINILSLNSLKAQKVEYKQLSLEDNGYYSTFSLLDSAVKNYKVFFTGENHTFRKSNYMLQLKMLKYLYKNAGVRHLFIEFGYSRGWLINQYVQTGDSSLLKTINDYSYKEYTLLYKSIYEFNKTLAPEEKITITGIDLERSITSSIKVMSMLFPKTEAPKEISVHVDAIRALAIFSDQRQQSYVYDEENYDYEYTRSYYNENTSMKYFLLDFDSNTVLYKKYLGDNFTDFARIVSGIKGENLRSKYQNSGAIQSYIHRENFMYDRMMELINQYPDDKFYSQFGRCHTSLNADDYWCGYYFYRTLATRLNNSTDSTLNNKVLSIACYYPLASGKEKGVTGIKNLEELLGYCVKDELTMIKVGNDSVFFSDFIGKFQFVIVNWNNPLEDRAVDDSVKIVKHKNKSNDQGRLSFSGRYSYNFSDLKSMNNDLVISPSVFNGFSSLRNWIGGEMHYQYNLEGHFSVLFDKMIPEAIPYGFSTLSFDGYLMKVRGGNEFAYSKHIAFMPYAGWGYGKLYLEERSSIPLGTTNGVFKNDHTVVTYKNPFFVIELGLNLKFQISAFSFGIEAGGQVDLSGRRWRYEGEYDNSTPRTSMNGYYITATAGLSIPFND